MAFVSFCVALLINSDSKPVRDLVFGRQLGGESMLGLEAKRPIPVSWVPDAGAAEV